MAAERNVVFEIVIGTYEKYLLGYQLIIDDSERKSFQLLPSFSNEAHIQSVKCISSSTKYIASGSTDETIQLFNLKTRQELGSLLHHNGTITSLEFYDAFLLSTSEDGTIGVWTINNWQCAKTLRGHKTAVSDISIHPSGKMALSVSKDKTLRTWNLIKGRSAYVTNIKKDADIVQWSPNGNLFLVACGSVIDVYSTENAGILHTYDFQKRICALTFINEDVCAVGGDDTHLHFFDVNTGAMVNKFKAHSNRIKGIKCVNVSIDTFLVTASSDGYIKVWHIDITQVSSKPERVAKVNTTSRPTCITVIPNF